MFLENATLAAFLVLCRVGACLMVVPGFSSARVPVRVRLLLAVALAAAISPLVTVGNSRLPDAGSAVGLAHAILAECAVGLSLGLLARLMMEAIEFAGTAISNYVGLAGFSGDVIGNSAMPALANLIVALATLLLMLSDLPHRLVVALVSSYDVLPLGTMPDALVLLEDAARTLRLAFLLALQISAPFLVFGLFINIAFGIVGRLVPQIPSFFVSGPFIAMGGLLVLYFAANSIARGIGQMLDMTRFWQ